MKKPLGLVLLLVIVVSCKKAHFDDQAIDDAYNDADLVAFTTANMPFDCWVYEGDSITDVSVLGNAYNYPYQLTRINTGIANTKQVNVATSGDQVLLMLNEYDLQVKPQKPQDNTKNYAFALMAGTNDAAAGRGSVQIYNDLKTEWGKARADGFKVIAFCITRSTYDFRDTVAINVNKLIVADKTRYDYLIRTDLVLPDPADKNYFYDGLHPTKLGSLLIAEEVINICKKK
jgi:lysophospholipase L1-like esterase